MYDQQVNISFDFDDELTHEKEKFLDYLSGEKWNQLNTENNWSIDFKEQLSTDELLNLIKKDIKLASEISKIKNVDYMILSEESIYFNSIN